MKHLFVILFIVITNYSFSQDPCQCEDDLDFVINYYEKNLPAFKDNVTPKTKSYYETLKKKLYISSTDSKSKLNCFKLLTKYVEFFKDNHSSIRMYTDNIDEKDSIKVEKFYNSEIFKTREILSLNEDQFKEHLTDPIRGLYETKDQTYTIAVFPNKTEYRDYVGVIVNSKSKLWKKGQVKIEFKKIPNSQKYEAYIYMRNHSLQYTSNFTFSNGILGGNWYKTSLTNKHNYALDISNEFKFEKLNDSTAYLRVSSFSGSQSAKIDALYKKSFNTIRKTPYLIIDVRNNGGGSDDNVMPLLEFIYTNKIKTDKVDLYVTPDNIKMWEKWYNDVKKDTVNFSGEDVAWYKNEIEKQLKAKPYSFIKRSNGGKMSRNYKTNAIKKVAIIFNRKSASSCETLLFWAMQSSKTILVGENSGGYVGYGEIGSVLTPCLNFQLGCTMTRYREQRKFEANGIPPHYYLSNKKNWIEQTLELLN